MIGPSDENLRGVVPSSYVSLLFDYLERQGHIAHAILGEGRPKALGRHPVTRWRAMLERAAAHLRDPLLGLHLGRTITPAYFGVMGYVLLACPNVAAAFLRFQQYQRLLYDVNPMHYAMEADTVMLEWGVEAGRPGPLVDECAITALVQLLRDITDRRANPLEVRFVNPPPADPKPYREYFGCPVHFAQAATAVRYPAKIMALPLRGPDPALLDVLERQADALLDELPRPDDFEQGVRRCIARLAREGEPSLERVANELHCSTRTLHRRLEQRGGSFRGLVDDTRRRLADDYLTDPRLQLAEIAQLLGYSEQSAFTRAYRRWTGRTPKATRQLATARSPGV
ncbi:AraC family transcriptional regulator [Oleomonas cavernae]|uniref:AraC family transcriptional regulator n=1 Tax=Oleomonas cavernae TaxID=2320859 RepID=A0A418WBL9_9PROT|nr:AraC family transcriptional regulator [Oleomonas cavernae]RJF87431.1 AraC family transcriptional regulator [Oleomonas cavernae]